MEYKKVISELPYNYHNLKNIYLTQSLEHHGFQYKYCRIYVKELLCEKPYFQANGDGLICRKHNLPLFKLKIIEEEYFVHS